MHDERTNPSYRNEWTDDVGRQWHRRGNKELDPRRVRSLAANKSVLLATWWAFQVEWHDDVVTKRGALERLGTGAGPDDLRFSEWQTSAGQRALVVERFC